MHKNSLYEMLNTVLFQRKVENILDSKDWLILKTIHEEKNITKAAQRLFISQPAITYRIQQLEKEFDRKILITENKGIQFTTEGEFLVEYSKKMLLEEQKMKDSILSMSSTLRGTLRIGASNSYAHYRLPSILGSFLTVYPEVKIMVKTGLSSEMMTLLLNNEIHIAIENVGYTWSEDKISVGTEKIVVISRDKINIEDLPYLSMIKYTKNPYLKHLIDNWWQKTFDLPPLINIDVSYVETCKEMVKNGLGFAIVPEFCIREQDNLNTITLFDENKAPLTRHNWLNYRNASLKITIVKKFIDFITNYNELTVK